MLAAVNASQIEMRPFLSMSAPGSVSDLMKYSGKIVSKRCITESVAVMTTRRGPARCSRNGELAAVESTTTMPPGIGFSSAAHSFDDRSGPTRVYFAHEDSQ